jgi:hypothetical protein
MMDYYAHLITAWAATYYHSNTIAVCWFGIILAVTAVREFIAGFLGISPPARGSRKGAKPSVDDGWVHEPLQTRSGREWERRTGSTIESRRRK